MAERRMFAKTIVDSDAFLDMPMSARLLYYDLGMRGDDDGFVNSPKTIMRMTRSSEDDLKLLAAKKFVIPFESGIVVIKHWKIHNYIRNDRYCETKYKAEKSLLELDENNAYRVTDGIPNVGQLVDTWDTQDRLGKDRLGEVSIGKDSIGNKEILVDCEQSDPPKYQHIVDLYHQICTSLPRVIKLTAARKKTIKLRLNDYSEIELINVFEIAQASKFLTGHNDRNWVATFDFIMKPDKLVSILEGKYSNKEKSQKDIVSEKLNSDIVQKFLNSERDY